jgi:hypothetical protein
MDDNKLLQMITVLLGGGAMGAVITAIVTHIRNKVQPVGVRHKFIHVFKDTLGLSSSLVAQLRISDGQHEFHFDNLTIVQLTLINKGNKDIDEFRFGVTLGKGQQAIHVEKHSEDRHHIIDEQTVIHIGSPSSEIDFILKPFHRGDTYSLDVYYVAPKGEDVTHEVTLSSPCPGKFVYMPSLREAAKDVALGILKDATPMKYLK